MLTPHRSLRNLGVYDMSDAISQRSTENNLSCSDMCWFWIIGFFALLLIALAFIGQIDPIIFILGMIVIGCSVIVLAFIAISKDEASLYQEE